MHTNLKYLTFITVLAQLVRVSDVPDQIMVKVPENGSNQL
jgi:hypothetical protein